MNDKIFRGEIYYIHEAEVHGSEQFGGRPGIIVSNDVGNEHSPVAIVVYLTTQEKKKLPTHVKITTAARPSVALCEQIETVYKGRIGSYIGQISETEQKYLDKALGISIGIGVNIKANKAVETWAAAYHEEATTAIADALKGIETTDFPEAVEEPEQVPVEPPKAEADKELPDSLIRMQIERDVYKELYMNLLKESMTLGKQVN